jgi:hypothetical protein
MNIYNLINALDELANELYSEAGQLQDAARFLRECGEGEELREKINDLKERTKNWIKDDN